MSDTGLVVFSTIFAFLFFALPLSVGYMEKDLGNTKINGIFEQWKVGSFMLLITVVPFLVAVFLFVQTVKYLNP